MTCPVCGEDTKIVDSRTSREGESIRRRRECLVCRHRFTTREVDTEMLERLERIARTAREVEQEWREKLKRMEEARGDKSTTENL